MSRLIDADALMKEIKLDISDDGFTESMTFYRIMNAPTIDAVSVVRCRECKHRPDSEWLHCSYVTHMTSDDDFCSYGEREGEQ